MKTKSKIYVSIFMVIAVFLIVSFWSFRQNAQSNNSQEAVISYGTTNEPIRIVAFKVGNMPVENEKKFISSEHWLKDLRAVVKNKYAKVVNYVEIGVIVSRPEGEEDKPPFHFTMTAGIRKKSLKKERTGFELSNNPNNDEAELGISEREYNDIRTSLNRLGYPNGISKIQIIIEEVGFTDGTLWSIGSWYIGDPKNPRKLMKIGQKKILTKKEAFLQMPLLIYNKMTVVFLQSLPIELV